MIAEFQQGRLDREAGAKEGCGGFKFALRRFGTGSRRRLNLGIVVNTAAD
jgi:hypothetical protein